MRRDSQPGHVTTHSCVPVWVRVYVRAFLIHDATNASRDIRLCWRGRERTLVRADAHVHVEGMDRRSRASPSPSFLPSHNPPCLSIPPTSRLSFTLSPFPARSFFHSFSLYLPTDPRSALPPTRLVRTIGVSTLETLHAWHTCKRARKSTQYI